MKQLIYITTALLLAISVFAQVAITPANPSDNDNLVCGINGANPAAYIYRWYANNEAFGSIQSNTIPASLTSSGQIWACHMYPNIPGVSASIGSASVTIVNSIDLDKYDFDQP